MKIRKKIITWILAVILGFNISAPLCSEYAWAENSGSSTQETEAASMNETEDASADGVYENARFSMKVNYGFNGQFRMGAAIPVSVSISSMKDDFEGSLNVIIPGNTDYSTAPVSYKKEITLKKGVEKTITMSVYDLSYITGFEVLLKNKKDVTVLDKTFQISSNNGTSALVGVLCDEYDALAYLDQCDINAGEYLDRSTLVRLNRDTFPEQQSGLEALSYLIIDNYSSSQLDERQLEAIKGWISTGGVLILGGGKNGPRTLAAFQEDLIDYTQGKSLAGTLQLKGDGQYVESMSEETTDALTDQNNSSDSVQNSENTTETGNNSAAGGDAAAGTADTAGGDATAGTADTAGGDAAAGTADTAGGDAAAGTANTAGGDAATGEQKELTYISIDRTPCQYTVLDGVMKLTLNDAEPMVSVLNDASLILNKDYGRGHVIVTAFDLSSDLIQNWNSKEDFATVLLSEAASGYSAERLQELNYYDYSDHHEEATALYHMIQIKTPDFKTLMIIFGVFVLLIGLVFYIFLRIIDKRSLLWVLVPVAAVVCCGTILYVTAGIRIKHPVAVSMTEQYYDTDSDSGETTVDLLTVVPGTDAKTFKMQENLYGPCIYNMSETSSLLPFYQNSDNESYDANVEVSENSDGYELVIDNDRTFDSTFIRMKTDEENSESALKLEAERTLTGVSGTVTNQSDYDMKCVSVYVKGTEIAIGDVKAGESASFTLAENKNMDSEFQQLGMPDVEMGTVEYDQIERVWDIFYERYLSDMDAMDVYTFGYIDEIGKNYIEDKKITEENTEIVIRHDSMGYKEYEGAGLYDIYTYLGDHENGFMDDDTQVLNGEETKCTFLLPITDVRYLVRSDITQAGSDSDGVKVYAYNGKTGKYEELFKDKEQVKFEENCPYLAEDGSMTLKFVCTDPGFECAPDLTVVGGEE